MLLDIEKEWSARREAQGKGVLGRDRIERQNPHDQPAHMKTSRAPLVHAASPEVYRSMLERYREFVGRYRRAADQLRQGLEANFPEGCFRPPGRFVPYSRAGP